VQRQRLDVNMRCMCIRLSDSAASMGMTWSEERRGRSVLAGPTVALYGANKFGRFLVISRRLPHASLHSHLSVDQSRVCHSMAALLDIVLQSC
jgi:hypothetical protein